MMLIGMIIPDQTNPFFAELSSHLQIHLAQVGVPLVVLSSDNNPEEELKCMQTLEQLSVSGIVFVSAGDDTRIHDILNASNKPLIIVDRELPATQQCDFVLTDNTTGIELAVDHLVAREHRKLAFIEGAQSTDPGRARLLAFRDATRQLNVDQVGQLELEGKFDYRSGYDAAKTILGIAPAERPTAVIASNDLSAIGALQCFQEHDLQVPRDISIIGFDDIVLCQWTFPRLTTIRQDTVELTRSAAKFLMDRLSNEYDGQPRVSFVTPRLVVRQSTRQVNDNGS